MCTYVKQKCKTSGSPLQMREEYLGFTWLSVRWRCSGLTLAHFRVPETLHNLFLHNRVWNLRWGEKGFLIFTGFSFFEWGRKKFQRKERSDRSPLENVSQLKSLDDQGRFGSPNTLLQLFFYCHIFIIHSDRFHRNFYIISCTMTISTSHSQSHSSHHFYFCILYMYSFMCLYKNLESSDERKCTCFPDLSYFIRCYYIHFPAKDINPIFIAD